jgi:S1-C subfamily serine protease
MRTKTVFWLVSVVALSLLGASMLRAQRPRAHPRGVAAWTVDDGQSWLGVRLEDVTADKVGELKLPGEYGAIVTHVGEDSPADKAGLKENDVVLEFAGDRVRSVAQLKRLIRETPQGRNVTLKVSHDGQTRTANVALAARQGGLAGPHIEMPELPEIPRIQLPDFYFNFSSPRLGISPGELTPQLAEYFGVKTGKGVLVREIEPGTPADKAGLKAGDCIVRVDTKPTGSVGDLHSALANEAQESADGKREVELTLVRDRHEQKVKVELERRSHPRSPSEGVPLRRSRRAVAVVDGFARPRAGTCFTTSALLG